MARKGLGDLVESALSSVGITEERLSGWLGRPCGCRKRREKLNRLSDWAARVIGGATKEESIKELAAMAEDESLLPIAEEIPEQPPKTGEG